MHWSLVNSVGHSVPCQIISASFIVLSSQHKYIIIILKGFLRPFKVPYEKWHDNCVPSKKT